MVALRTSFFPLNVFDYVDLETKTLQGAKGESSLSSTGTFLVDNSSVDFQKFPDKEILRMTGPLTADFIVKVSAFRFSRHIQTVIYNLLKREREFGFGHRFGNPITQEMFNSTSPFQEHIFPGPFKNIYF